MLSLRVGMRRVEGGRNERHSVRRVSLSLVIGFLIAICGLMPYYRPNLVVGGRFDVFFKVAGAMFMPGLLAAALLGGNVHDPSLAVGFVASWLLYGLWVFVLLIRKEEITCVPVSSCCAAFCLCP